MRAIHKMNLTDKRVENLKSSDRRELYYDAKETNLAVAVNPGGKKTYFLVMSVNNKTLKRPLGTTDNLTLDDARIGCAALRSQIRKTGVVPEKNSINREPTVFDLYNNYMRKHAKVHLKSWRSLEQYWESHLYVFKSVKATNLSAAKIENWFLGVGENNGKHMANRLLSLLGAIFNKATEWGHYSGSNPTIGIKKFNEKPRERYLKEHELTILSDALEKEPCLGFQSFVRLSLMTGARFSNVVGMKWQDLDLNCELPTWTIPAEEMKNGITATLPLTSTTVSVIMEHDCDDRGEYVLHDSIPLETIKRRWRANFSRLVKKSGINDLRIHDLRRTFGSKLAQNGVSLHQIAKALGQKSTRATPIYARLNDRSVRDAVQSIEGYF